MRIDVRHNTRSRFNKFKGAVRLFTHTLLLKMANGKVRSVFTESNIHSESIFWTVGENIYNHAGEGIPNKHTCLSLRDKFGLIRAKIMDISGTPKHTKWNLRNKTSRGIRLHKTI